MMDRHVLITGLSIHSGIEHAQHYSHEHFQILALHLSYVPEVSDYVGYISGQHLLAHEIKPNPFGR